MIFLVRKSFLSEKQEQERDNIFPRGPDGLSVSFRWALQRYILGRPKAL
jgi:hypothetical protein